MADKGRYKENDPLLACDVPIDQAGLLVHHELVLSGWAVSAHGIAGVALRIDGERQLQASYGLDSPWVAETIPDMPGAEAAAYELRLDTSEWAPGTHSIEIVATDGKGRRAAISGQVEAAPFAHPRYTVEDNRAAIAAGEPVMWLEEPRIVDGVPELSGALEVSGWAYSTQGIESVNVTLDRRDRREALRPVSRADLLADYGSEVAAGSGFVLRLDPAELSPGTHAVSVVAVARDGRAVGVEGKVVCPPEPPQSGDGRGPLQVEWLAEREAPRLRGHRGAGADAVDRHAERLLEAEQELRYQWAAALVSGRDVLDAGRGAGGAAELLELPHGDASFDLVTCFDMLHEVGDPDAALAEMQRVLRPDGVLLVSVPRLTVDLDGGHRSPGLSPGDLERTVRECFDRVAVYRQQTCLSSVIDEKGRPSGDGDEDIDIDVRGIYPARPGEEVHAIVVAGARPLPELKRMAVLASAQPVREALGSALMWEDRARLAEADAAASRTEANLAQMHQKGLVGKLSEAEARARSLEALEASFSWRITRPLRALKRRLGSPSASK